jgi:hypothetical protein
MAYSLKQAGEATGRTKPTILRAIQTGKISAKKNEMGEWEIEPAEFHRVYPPVAEGVTPTVTPEYVEGAVELLLLRQELTAKGERLAFLLDERDRECRQLTALPTGQQGRVDTAKDKASPDGVPAPRRRFLRFFPPSRKRRR